MLKKSILTILSILYMNILYANPSPLGLEINKATLDDVKKSYKILMSGQNATEGFYNNVIECHNIPMDTLSNVNVISNNNKIVEGVILDLSSSKFDEIYKMLSSKYKEFYNRNKFEGSKYAKFYNGDCFISIEMIHLDNKIILAYISNNFKEKHERRISKEKEDKERQTKELL